MRWLLNSAVIPIGGDGDYRYHTISRDEAVTWLQQGDFESRIGYPENATYIKRISGLSVAINRSESPLQPGDVALVVRPVYRQSTGNKRERFVPDDNDFRFGLLERLT